jgi:flagellar hook-associated protein 3 FlgL
MSVSSFARLGSANTYDNALRNLQTRQTSLANLQEQLTSGKKITSPSDDPTGAAQAERAMTRIARIATDQRALESQRNSITVAEGALGDIATALQNFRELAVSAGNGTHTAADRQTIALQLSGLRDQVLSIANKNDSNGQPLFAALGSALAPFVGPQSTAPDYTFNGLPGQATSTETTIPFTLDGDAAFMHQPTKDGVYNVTTTNTAAGNIPNGRMLQTDGVTLTNSALVNGSAYTINVTGVDTTTVPGQTTVTYDVLENPNVGGPYTGQTGSFPTSQTTGVLTVTAMPGLSLKINGTPAVNDQITVTPAPSLFSTLDSAIKDIGSAANDNAAAQAVKQVLANLDIGMAKVSAVRGRAGDLLNRADRITSNNDNRTIQQEADRSRAEDVDMIKGISDFQNQQTGYSAALQSYAQVQKLSLFNFIG